MISRGRYSLLWLLLLICFPSILGIQNARLSSDKCTKWSREEYLDFDNRVYLQWKTEGDSLIMKATGITKGWLGVGFSTSGSMKGADILIAWVKNGKGYLQDRHGLSSENGRPPIDTKQNYQLLSSSENGTATSFCFTRKLLTCDDEDYPITNDTVRILWAMNPEDPADTNEASAKYHGADNRGASSQSLLRKSPPKPSMTGVQSFDVKVNKVSVPSDKDTYYWCQYFKRPNLTEKHHIIGFEPLMQKGNEMYIHHIELYECTGDNVNELIEKEMNNDFSKGIPCLTRDSPSSSFHCQKEVMFWAPGSKGQYFPPETGYPIGNDKFKYYLGSFHYNNPSKISGITDSSGIRILYTKQLRKYDAGLLLLGYSMHQPYLIIPPGQKNWTSVAHCSLQCLQDTDKGQELHVYGVQYHMHLSGRKLKLRHFRNGTELPPIAENNNYDFYNQQPQQFYGTISVLPTDFLTTECYFNTSDRTNVTLDDLKIKEPESLRNVSLRSYLQQYQFSEKQIQTLREGELKANKTPSCVVNGDIYEPKDLTSVNYPSSFRPYVEPDVCGADKSKK